MTTRFSGLALPSLAVAIAACRVTSPPPFVPMHASTAPSPEGTTTAMLIVGGGLAGLGGGAIGLAVRIEEQTKANTTAGLEFAVGAGDADPPGGEGNRYFDALMIRPYARLADPDRDWLAVTAGLGLTVLNTGAIIAAPHVGVAVGAPNDTLVPTLQLSGAISVPLRQGSPFLPCKPKSDDLCGQPLPLTYYGLLDLGIVVPHGAQSTTLDLGVGLGAGGTNDAAIMSASVGTTRAFE